MANYEVTGDVLKVTGVLDTAAEAQLRTNLQKLFDGGAPKVSVDFTGVTMITSICIGGLVAFWIDLNGAGRKLDLTASETVKRVLDMTGLTSVLMT
jgi:anti-anti-sigma factor